MPPISIEGPNTPPLPPELIVRPVATIFTSDRIKSMLIVMLGMNGVSPTSANSTGMPIAPHCTQP